jgi:signal transduction histidine kinase
LRTPLALILGLVQSILAQTTNLTELQRRDLGEIHRNAATTLKHVNDLLDLAKMDQRKQTVYYARVDLARATRTVASERSQCNPNAGEPNRTAMELIRRRSIVRLPDVTCQTRKGSRYNWKSAGTFIRRVIAAQSNSIFAI